MHGEQQSQINVADLYVIRVLYNLSPVVICSIANSIHVSLQGETDTLQF